MSWPLEVLLNDGQGMAGPDVTDGVAALVGGPILGVYGAWSALAVRNGCIRFQGMTVK